MRAQGAASWGDRKRKPNQVAFRSWNQGLQGELD